MPARAAGAVSAANVVSFGAVPANIADSGSTSTRALEILPEESLRSAVDLLVRLVEAAGAGVIFIGAVIAVTGAALGGTGIPPPPGYSGCGMNCSG